MGWQSLRTCSIGILGFIACTIMVFALSAACEQTGQPNSGRESLTELINLAKSDVALKEAKHNIAKAAAAVSLARQATALARTKTAAARLALSTAKVEAESPGTAAYVEAEATERFAEANLEMAEVAAELAAEETLKKKAEVTSTRIDLKEAENTLRKLVAQREARS